VAEPLALILTLILATNGKRPTSFAPFSRSPH
jgi:hypothetical protein